jgi:hypothetical protein
MTVSLEVPFNYVAAYLWVPGTPLPDILDPVAHQGTLEQAMGSIFMRM